MPGPARFTFSVWGSTAVVVTPNAAQLVAAAVQVRAELRRIDDTCSRFRDDTDLARVNAANGRWVAVDPLFVEAVEIALAAAKATDGLVSPIVGEALERIGYDRDLSLVSVRVARIGAHPRPIGISAWRRVEVDPAGSRVRTPAGVKLDLGATAKALAADRSALHASAITGDGVLVSLGGDVAVAGTPPPEGWRIGMAEDHRSEGTPGETVAVTGGGIATSSTRVRRWIGPRGPVHHIIDPRTGEPATEIWRTVSIAAGTCVDANTAATAAIVMGEPATAWLAGLGLPARLVRRDGRVVRVSGWPERNAA